MSSRLGDRLSAARRRSFIGRTSECNLFATTIRSADLPFPVLHISGPGGVGKTLLLGEFNAIAQEAGVAAHLLDARNFEPTPDAFLNALHAALSRSPDGSPTAALADRRERLIILLDTYELLAPLDDWLRDVFLPQLSENVLVVLAGRNPPTPGWRADPGWQSLVRVLALRNLSSSEGRQYLVQRGVPTQELQAVLDFTHSYPLALSLVADLYDQRPDFHFKPSETLDVIKILLEQFLQRVPGPAHRAALEACALVRVTTESLLATLVSLPDAHELFEWLRGLSFIQTRPGGLFPHDIAREVLTVDLRWRNPDWYTELHRRARTHYIQRLQQTQGAEQQLALFDFVYLHRDNPVVRPFFEWQSSGRTLADHLTTADVEILVAMVARYEGDESAQLARYWLGRQPESVTVFRDGDGLVAGWMISLALERTDAKDLATDAAIAQARDFLSRHVALRTGESAVYFRFWMAADAYQGVSPTQSVIFINMVRHYFISGLAYTFYACADPNFWQPVFAYAELERLPELDFTVGGRSFGVYGHNWRAMPPMAWLDLLGQRETALAPQAIKPPEPAVRLVALNRDAFAQAVEGALHDYARPDLLRNNPLLLSRIVQSRAQATADDAERVKALRNLLKETAELLQHTPKESKFYRAVYHTYLHPAPTQEQAAERIDVPFSSYRRHLKAGMLHIADILWHTETGGAGN